MSPRLFPSPTGRLPGRFHECRNNPTVDMCYKNETNNSSGGPDLEAAAPEFIGASAICSSTATPSFTRRDIPSASGDRSCILAAHPRLEKVQCESSGHLSGIRSRDQRDGGGVATPHRRRACRVSCGCGGKRHPEGHSVGSWPPALAQSRDFPCTRIAGAWTG